MADATVSSTVRYSVGTRTRFQSNAHMHCNRESTDYATFQPLSGRSCALLPRALSFARSSSDLTWSSRLCLAWLWVWPNNSYSSPPSGAAAADAPPEIATAASATAGTTCSIFDTPTQPTSQAHS